MKQRDKKGRFLKGHFQFNTGRTHFKKGHLVLNKTKEKIRLTAIKKGIKPPRLLGKNHPSWIDGRSKTKEYKNFFKRQYKHRKKEAIGSHTFEEWENLKKHYQYMCICCKRQEPEIKLTEDHIIPLSKGGSNNIENIQPLCRSCNGKKKDKAIDYKK